MIHILTIHHGSDRFIRLQADAIAKYSLMDYSVICGFDGFTPTYPGSGTWKFARMPKTTHASRLDLLARHTISNANDSDMLCFIDSDAFPVRMGWDVMSHRYLKNVGLVAIKRQENWDVLDAKNETHPHCSFIITTVSYWKSGAFFHDDSKKCCGWNIGERLRELGHRWFPLLRSNAVNVHPLMFGIYGDMIYHHGGGNRIPYDGIDVGARPGLGVGTDLDLKYPNILDFNSKLSELVYRQLCTDENYIHHYLMGVRDATF